MKKIFISLMVLSILFTNTISAFAEEVETFIVEVTVDSEAKKAGEIQRIYIHYSDELNFREVDKDLSMLTIQSEKTEKEIRGLKQDAQGDYFEIIIDKEIAFEESWNIKKVDLYLSDGEVISKENFMQSFNIDNDELKENEQESPEQEKNNDLEIEDNNVVDAEEKKLLLAETPDVSNVVIDVKNGYYVITAKISSKVSRVQFPTWTVENGQDDIVWGTGVIAGDVVTYTVEMKDHKYELGDYSTHIYSYDNNGVRSYVKGIKTKMQYMKPSITNVKVQDGNGKYTITADVEGYNITKVQFPTWTVKNGQDDIKWGTGTVVNGKITYTVEMKDHKNETGRYVTHIYVYDGNGGKSVIAVNHTMQYTKPVITNVKVQDGNGKYTITADVDGYNITKVQFPTWTDANGKDDIKWGSGVIKDGKISYTVEMKDHRNETGKYTTHIYVYDQLGNKAVMGVYHSMKYEKPSISNVKIEDRNGSYTITANVDGYNITKVQFPTWTDANGKDDIKWGNGVIKDGKISYTVEMKDHRNETGRYTTHIYVYDQTGNKVVMGVYHDISYTPPKFSQVNVESRAGKYIISAKIKGYNITKVRIPTWTDKNGKDDIKWYETSVNNGIFTYTIDMKNHNYETGKYTSHIYAYDATGNYSTYGVYQTIENKPPVISNVTVSDVSAQGYLVTCTVTDDYAIDRVMFPTWSINKGQDDIVWGKGDISGSKVSFRVYVKDHKYDFGDYKTHIYAYDAAGVSSALAVPTVSINSTSVPGWKIVDGRKYLYDAAGNLVRRGTFVIDVSEHNGNIDWLAVKNAGVDAVILRSSYGYEDDSLSQMDDYFIHNVSELNRLGIPYGIYHFSYARNESEGVNEANFVLRCLKAAGAKPSLPIYYDLESSPYVGEKSPSFYMNLTRNFANTIKMSGYQVGVYANQNWWDNKLTDTSFNSYTKWIANYGTINNNAAGTANPNWHPNGEYKMWQYSSCGKINGISGNVDMNILF